MRGIVTAFAMVAAVVAVPNALVGLYKNEAPRTGADVVDRVGFHACAAYHSAVNGWGAVGFEDIGRVVGSFAFSEALVGAGAHEVLSVLPGATDKKPTRAELVSPSTDDTTTQAAPVLGSQSQERQPLLIQSQNCQAWYRVPGPVRRVGRVPFVARGGFGMFQHRR